MPIYEYECDSCGCRFERKQSMSDDPIRTCPKCPGAVRRLIHAVGVVFKGNGFYATDNRKSAYSSDEKKSIPVSGTKPVSDTKPASGAKAD